MLYENLILGQLIKRYKRFFVEIQLANGEVVTAHCPNTGKMTTCLEENALVGLSESKDKKRKLKYTLEIIKPKEIWIGVNTLLTNKIVKEALENGQIEELTQYQNLKTEVKWGNSRIDFQFTLHGKVSYLEVKSVTLCNDGLSIFPDTITIRGKKHLEALIDIARSGQNAYLMFLCQREDAQIFEPAFSIDPEYCFTLQKALKEGVKILCYKSKVFIHENIVYSKMESRLYECMPK